MRTRTTLVTVLALTSWLIACGDDGEGSPSTTLAPTTAAPGTTLTPAQLDTMRLTVDDVGTFWKVGSPINEADIRDSVQVPCGTALDPAVVERLRADTGIQFEPADGSYGLITEFLTAGEPAQLEADMQVLMDAFTACPPTSTVPDGSGYEGLGSLALPDLGDQRFAVQATTQETAESEVVWFVRSAVVRVGSVMVTVGLIEVVPVDTDPTISDEEFIRFVTAAVAHVTG